MQIFTTTQRQVNGHAAFPDGVVDEVNYDGSIRAFLFLLNNDCCVSIDKSRKFLSDLTGGKLNISRDDKQTQQEFALKTVPERRATYADMLLSPVMHTDCTNAKENGKAVMYTSVQYRMEKSCTLPVRKKGMKG